MPLIPPPDGEKFEGGYHIERNPITGGVKLVPPSKVGQFILQFLSEVHIHHGVVGHRWSTRGKVDL